jgi:TrkA domain protein
MHTTRTTVPGFGELHDLVTRHGQHFRIIADRTDTRELHLYGDAPGPDPIASIVLEPDEAERTAELLHSTPMADRLARVERQLAAIAGGS